VYMSIYVYENKKVVKKCIFVNDNFWSSFYQELVDRNCLFLEEMLWDCCKEHRTKVVGQGHSEGQGDTEGQEKTHVSYK
jgi:hypothetical protein